MKKTILASCVFLLATATGADAKSTLVTSPEEFRKAEATLEPGDVILLENGRWEDAELSVRRSGTAEKPVTIRAKNPGQVILTGNSVVTIQGHHVVVSGLWFKGASTRPKHGAIIFGKGSRHSRVTDTRVESYDRIDAQSDYWVLIFGKYNRLDHCSFVGKTLAGQTIRYMENLPTQGDNFNRIDSCYFGPRPDIGANGAETIQFYDRQWGGNFLEYNLFEECDGEDEIVSVKSSRNVVRGNVFVRCKGEVVNRQKDGNQYIGNYFFGHGKRGTGGIRISGRNNRMYNNYLADLELRGLEVKNGDTDDFYPSVSNLVVAFNTFVDCKETIKYGSGHSSRPVFIPPQLEFVNNIVRSDAGPLIFHYDKEHDPIVTYRTNLFFGADPEVSLSRGIIEKNPQLIRHTINGYIIYKPSAKSPAHGAASVDADWVQDDIEGRPRGSRSRDIGCHQHGKEEAALLPIARKDTGTSWEVASATPD